MPAKKQSSKKPPQQQQQAAQLDISSIPPADPALCDVAESFFVWTLQTLPPQQQMEIARSTIVHLARALRIGGASAVVAVADSKQISALAACILVARFPSWVDTSASSLDTTHSPAPGQPARSIRQYLLGAMDLAKQASYSFSPSVAPARSVSPPPAQPNQGPRVTIVSSSSSDDPAPQNVRPSTASAPHTRPSAAATSSARQPSSWRSGSTIGRPEEALAATVAAIAERQAKDDPIWCSHQPMSSDIFEEDERDLLLRLPRYLLVKAEPKFDDLKRTIQQLARWCLEHLDDNEATLAQWFSSELSKQRDYGVAGAALSVDHACELKAQISLHCTQGEPSALAACAEFSVLVSRSHFKNFPRLRVARIAAVPASAAEVAKWMKDDGPAASAANMPTARGVSLPVRSSGF